MEVFFGQFFGIDYLAVVLFRLKENLKKSTFTILYLKVVVEYIPSLIYTPHANRFRSRRHTLQFINQTQRSVFLTERQGTGRPL
jgi:hypothetical protein